MTQFCRSRSGPGIRYARNDATRRACGRAAGLPRLKNSPLRRPTGAFRRRSVICVVLDSNILVKVVAWRLASVDLGRSMPKFGAYTAIAGHPLHAGVAD